MVHETWNAVHRHRSYGCIVDDGVHDKLRFIVHCQCPLDLRVSFFHPCLAQVRYGLVIVAVVPRVQGSGCVASEFAANAVWLHSVFCPCFLIAECLFISARTSEIQLFLQNGLLAQIREDRIVEVQIGFAAPHALQALLVGMVMSDAAHADNIAVLLEALGEHAPVVRRNTYCCGLS